MIFIVREKHSLSHNLNISRTLNKKTNLSEKQSCKPAFYIHKNCLLLSFGSTSCLAATSACPFRFDKRNGRYRSWTSVLFRSLFPRVNVLRAEPTTNQTAIRAGRAFESGAVERRRSEEGKGLNTLIGEWLATLHYEAKLLASKSARTKLPRSQLFIALWGPSRATGFARSSGTR